MLSDDLKHREYKYKKNSIRPKLEGHERDDVIKERKAFIDYFENRNQHYYSVNEENNWVYPTEKPTVLIFHDESTFRSSEQLHSRWIKDGNEPFLNKGYQIKIIIY